MKIYAQLKRKPLAYHCFTSRFLPNLLSMPRLAEWSTSISKTFFSRKLIMRINLTILLLISALIQVNANSFAQKITIVKSNISLKEVLKEIELQSGYDVFYNSSDLKEAKPIDARFNNQDLAVVLTACFKNQTLTYTIKNKTIVVKQLPQKQQVVAVTVTGTIKDEKNLPMPGVSVKVKDGSTNVISDNNGFYKITVANTGVTLVYSYLGYLSQEKVVSAATEINIVLVERPTGLDEVVVVGYGAVKKTDLTGSVGQVDMKELEKAPVASFDQALAGRLAGVQVSANDGQPGAEGINIAIRGNGSLTQSSAPLYVIDGFPIEDFNTSSLNVNDIESINVLKDASATAIYGSRGANGVIVIETKKGQIGKPIVAYNGSYGVQQITKRMDVMNGFEFVKYQIDRGNGANYLRDGLTLDSYADQTGLNWQDKIFKTGRTNIQNISISGGTPQTKYSVSGSVFNSDAVIINTGNSRYQGRVSLNQELSKKVHAGININYSRNERYGLSLATAGGSSASAYLLFAAWGYRPITGNVNYSIDDLENGMSDEDVNPAADLRLNPVVSANNQYNKSLSTNVITNAFLTYEIVKNLTLKITGGLNDTYARSEAFHNSMTILGNNISPANTRGQFGTKNYSELSIWSNENTLSYVKQFNKNNRIDFVTGFTLQGTSISGGGYTSINVPNENLGVNGLAQGEPQVVTSPASNSSIQSFLFRTNYNYKSKYLLTATFRADGSSKFKSGNRWGYFPSGGFAWRMSSEPFMKELKAVSDAKLRLSYGMTGNNRVPDFAYFAAVNPTNNAAYPFGPDVPTQGVQLSSLGNSDLKWETTEQFNIGYDLSLFKNRINLTADVYRKVTKDLLLNAEMPFHTGYNTVFKNIGKLQNQGLELTLNTVNIKTKNFRWESNFNISFNRNKILALTETNESIYRTLSWESSYNNSNLYIAAVGQPAGKFFGFVWDGNYQYADFDVQADQSLLLKSSVPTNGNTRASIRPGDIKYRDLNGDGTVDLEDQTVIGDGNAQHIGGFTNNFSYKGFELGVFLQWSYGNDIYNVNRLVFEGTTAYTNLNQFASYNNRWTPENQNNEYHRVNGAGPAGRYSSRVIEDGSYLRLKTVALAYNIPSKYLKTMKIRSININLTAQNLLTLTRYSGMDPEVSVRNSVLTPGFDYSAYPHARTVVLGLKASF